MRFKLIPRYLLFAGLCVCLASEELWLRNALAFNTGRIVFTSTRDGNTDIYVMDIDGGNQERQTNNPANDSDPTWSSNRTKIAFVSNRNRGFVQIYIMDADEKNPIRLTDGVWEESPDWSLVGQKIAFTSRNAQGKGHIAVMDTNGKNLFKLTEGYNPSWSPDGTLVAFDRRNEEHHSQIHVINVNSHEINNLTRDLRNASRPVWSPNGRKIAYVSPEDGFYQIYVMNADGKNRKRLTNNRAHKQVDNRQPTWSPDGQTIAYVIFKYEDDGRTIPKIHLMTADGQYLKQLSDDHNGSDYHPDFGPGGLAVSPTSNTITIWGRLKKLSSNLR